MKLNNLIKVLPLFTSLLLIFILSVSNQKENAKLRLLIWNTPSLSLGSYLGISIGTGFTIAYCFTTSLAKLKFSQPIQKLRFKDNNQHSERNEYIDKPIKPIYDNTLIERDIKDPSPTITANFRIIGKKERAYNNYKSDNIKDDQPFESEDLYKDEFSNDETFNELNTTIKDWNDQSFSDW